MVWIGCIISQYNKRALVYAFLSGTVPGMDVVVSKTDMATIASEFIPDWKSLRPHLGLSQAQETAIHNLFPGNYEQQKLECLSKWLAIKGIEATYGALITAAKCAGNQLLADKVKALTGGMFMYTNWEVGTWYNM